MFRWNKRGVYRLALLMSVLALSDVTSATDYSSQLDGVLAGAQRSEANQARDVYRHPKETLSFFGLRPDMQVVELSPGSGWYTEILAPFLSDRGKLLVASFGADNPVAYRARLHREFMQKLADENAIYGKVQTGVLNPPMFIDLGPDESADMVVTFRNTHNWINDGVERDVYEAVYRVLKPGGIFGVVQHRGREGADPKKSAKTGYVPEAYVIETARRAGFKLSGSSEINANSSDIKDYPKGVWTLPPSYRMGDKDRQRWAAIGESDRMTLRFVKPTK